jgi:hypothetical protein
VTTDPRGEAFHLSKPIGLVLREELAPLGFLNDQQCQDILWNHTGWPCFWTSRSHPEVQIRQQLRDFVHDCLAARYQGA